MADETDTPETKPEAKPAPRRRAPRKEQPASAEAKKPARSRAKAAVSTDAPKEAAPAPTPARAKRAAPAKPRASKRPTPAPRRKASASPVEKATEKVGGKWGAAAVVGGLAAVGAAATAALLSLRGSTPKASAPEQPKLPGPGAGAHQPDGTDSSKSFEAGIADENTIPEA